LTSNLVEHEPVYTIGIRRENYSKNQLDELKLKTNASIEITDRGGLITYHGLGLIFLIYYVKVYFVYVIIIKLI